MGEPPSAYDVESSFAAPPLERGVFCNRTLNLRSLQAIGFDMDYTLLHYRTEDWEQRVYDHGKTQLSKLGWPVADLAFEPRLVTLGLIVDVELGNIVKADRFGYIHKAAHGTRMMSYPELRGLYSRELVDLEAPRWRFINTLFGLSEGCLYAQLVDLLDAGELPEPLGYGALYRRVRSTIDETHVEGTLKAEISRVPERYVVADPELPLALLDLARSGKRLMVITNSEWSYTRDMMAFAFDRHLPGDMTWRDLFEIVVVAAGKPDYFAQQRALFEIVDEERGLLRPARDLAAGKVFAGGDAGHVERYLEARGDEILFVGDHVFADVHASKSVLRWRTALVVRELERELAAIAEFAPRQRRLTELMATKQESERRYCQLRLAALRLEHGHGPRPAQPIAELEAMLEDARAELLALDAEIGPLAAEFGSLANPRWGLIMRTGKDKSHLARQIERHADIYMSRVSNLLAITPFAYLRSPMGTLPHDV